MDVKSNKKKIVFIASVIIVLYVIVGAITVRRYTEAKIIYGLSEIVDYKIGVLLREASNPKSDSHAALMGLQSVEYEVGDIKKDGNYYVFTLNINCVCEDADAPETSQSLLAFEVEKGICSRDYEGFYVGKYRCKYNWIRGYTYVNGTLVHSPRMYQR